MRRALILLALTSLTIAAACDDKKAAAATTTASEKPAAKTEKPATPPAAKPAAAPAEKPGDVKDPAAEAATILATRCAACHGTTGNGDGPAAAGLDPKPRKYSDKKWQASVTDEFLAKVIVEGGAANKLSPLMTANPDLKAKPKVVAELVKAIRAFAK